MRRTIVIITVYLKKLRATVWRAAKCPRPCDRLSSPLSVMRPQLGIRKNEKSNSCYSGLLVEVKTNDVESCMMLEAL